MPAVPSPRHVPGSAEWLIKIGDKSSECSIPSKGCMHASGTSRNESARLAAASGQEPPSERPPTQRIVCRLRGAQSTDLKGVDHRPFGGAEAVFHLMGYR